MTVRPCRLHSRRTAVPSPPQNETTSLFSRRPFPVRRENSARPGQLYQSVTPFLPRAGRARSVYHGPGPGRRRRCSRACLGRRPVMTEHHRFQDATICRCTSQSEDSDWADGRLDHVIFTPICLFYISTRRSSRRHNVVDLEAALICIALKMGQ